MRPSYIIAIDGVDEDDCCDCVQDVNKLGNSARKKTSREDSFVEFLVRLEGTAEDSWSLELFCGYRMACLCGNGFRRSVWLCRSGSTATTFVQILFRAFVYASHLASVTLYWIPTLRKPCASLVQTIQKCDLLQSSVGAVQTGVQVSFFSNGEITHFLEMWCWSVLGC